MGFGSDYYFYGMTETGDTHYLSSLEQDKVVEIVWEE